MRRISVGLRLHCIRNVLCVLDSRDTDCIFFVLFPSKAFSRASLRCKTQKCVSVLFLYPYINRLNHLKTMPLFQISVTRSFRGANVTIEPGMSVQVSTPYSVNPIVVDGGRIVNDAFMRIYGLDLKKAGLLTLSFLRADRIG